MLLEKVAFFRQFGLAVFHIANVVKIKFYSFFFSLFSRQHPLFEQQVQMPQNQRNKAIFIIAISCIKSLAINEFHGIVCTVNGAVRMPHRQKTTAKEGTEMSNRLETAIKANSADEKIKTEELFKALQ